MDVIRAKWGHLGRQPNGVGHEKPVPMSKCACETAQDGRSVIASSICICGKYYKPVQRRVPWARLAILTTTTMRCRRKLLGGFVDKLVPFVRARVRHLAGYTNMRMMCRGAYVGTKSMLMSHTYGARDVIAAGR